MNLSLTQYRITPHRKYGYATAAALVGTFLVASAFSQIAPKKLDEFDRYVDNARKQWSVPGMSIVVVKDGHVVFKKGYGVTELGKGTPVDTQTLFANASTTKAMNVAVLGMLVDEGKIKWDDHVTDYLPELVLYDPWVTRELRVRDLLIHNTGYPSTNFLTGIFNEPPDEMFRRLRDVQPQYSFRGGFEYQNTFYTVSGKLIERVTGRPWFEVMTSKLFLPLGMTTTVPKRGLAKTANMTRPHFLVRDTIRVLSYDTDAVIGAAGGVWSNADEMAIWMTCMLDSGKYQGKRLLSTNTWTEIFKPQTIFPTEEYPALSLVKPNWLTYGLGWYQIDYKGKKLNFHTGSIEGLTAIVGLMPEEKIGVFIYGNYDHAEVRHALLYKSLDFFALGGNRDWNGEVSSLFQTLKTADEKREQAISKSRVKGTSPSQPLQAFTGTYTSKLYGSVKVTLQGEQLWFDLNDQAYEFGAHHWNFDTFEGWGGEFRQYRIPVNFNTGPDGKIQSVRIYDWNFSR